MSDIKIPFWEKYLLTVTEAVEYYGIGEGKLRKLVKDDLSGKTYFTITNGGKALINKKKFEQYLDSVTAI